MFALAGIGGGLSSRRIRRGVAGVGGVIISPPDVPGYNLTEKLAALPFVVNTPTAPTTTSSHTVTTAAQMTTALAIAGADITVTANITGDFSANTTDLRITINSGVTISGVGSGANQPAQRALTVGASARRVHIKGPGAIQGSFFIASGAQDVRLDSGLTITTFTNASTADHDVVHLYGTRILTERVKVTSRTYCDYSAGAVDKVHANSEFITSVANTQSSIRMVGTVRGVVIDCRLTNPTHHCLRAHSFGATSSDYIYWARNQLETGGVMSNASAGNPNP